MNKAPCLECDRDTPNKRAINCHDRCSKYQNYKRVNENVKSKRKEESEINGYTVNNIHKFKKARNLERWMR